MLGQLLRGIFGEPEQDLVEFVGNGERGFCFLLGREIDVAEWAVIIGQDVSLLLLGHGFSLMLANNLAEISDRLLLLSGLSKNVVAGGKIFT